MAILAAGRAVASGGPAVKGNPAESSAPVAGEPVVVLVGGYGCTVTAYQYVPPSPPVPPPGDDPVAEPRDPAIATTTLDDPQTYIELSHSLGVTGSGGVTPSPSALPGPPPALGPGFGGRAPVVGGSILTPPVTPGLGAGGTFGGGSIDDCRRFAEAVLETARSQGCVASEIRPRSTIQPSVVQQESRRAESHRRPPDDRARPVGKGGPERR